jgi:shikimate kinase|tara:strand:+ start:684 stop:1205 length:522 start_codon:yes stop_codon:yes gene_type:complete
LKKSLVLTGMMGVGKSTIGSMLSSKIESNFIDIDLYIEKKEKLSIKQIFDLKGERYFRNLEREVSLNLLKKKNLVIALGGGAFIDPIIRKEVLRSSVSFWLHLSISNLKKRNFNLNKRPLLSDKNSGDIISKIYLERKNIYNLADFKINCDDQNKVQIVKKIYAIYEDEKDKH